MSYLTRIISITTLTLLGLALLAACTGGDANDTFPTPAGMVAGTPTFVYLWNSP